MNTAEIESVPVDNRVQESILSKKGGEETGEDYSSNSKLVGDQMPKEQSRLDSQKSYTDLVNSESAMNNKKSISGPGEGS